MSKRKFDFDIKIYKNFTYDLFLEAEVDKSFLHNALIKASKNKNISIDLSSYVDKIEIPKALFFPIKQLLKLTLKEIDLQIKVKYGLNFLNNDVFYCYVIKKEIDIVEKWYINIHLKGVVVK